MVEPLHIRLKYLFAFARQGKIQVSDDLFNPVLNRLGKAMIINLMEEEEIMAVARGLEEESYRIKGAVGRGLTVLVVLHQEQPAHIPKEMEPKLELDRIHREEDLFCTFLDHCKPYERLKNLEHIEVCWLRKRPLFRKEDEQQLMEEIAERADLALKRRALLAEEGGKARQKRESRARALMTEQIYMKKTFRKFSDYMEKLLAQWEGDISSFVQEIVFDALQEYATVFRKKKSLLLNRAQGMIAAYEDLQKACNKVLVHPHQKKQDVLTLLENQLQQPPDPKEEREQTVAVLSLLSKFFRREMDQKQKITRQANERAEQAIKQVGQITTRELEAESELEFAQQEVIKREESYHKDLLAFEEEKQELRQESITKQGAVELIQSIAKQRVQREGVLRIAEKTRRINDQKEALKALKLELGRQEEVLKKKQETAKEVRTEKERLLKHAESLVAAAKQIALEKRRENGLGELFINSFIRFIPFYPVILEGDQVLQSPADILDTLLVDARLPEQIQAIYRAFLPENHKEATAGFSIRDNLCRLEKYALIFHTQPSHLFTLSEKILNILTVLYAQFPFINSIYVKYASFDASPLEEIPANIELSFTDQKPVKEMLMPFRLYHQVWQDQFIKQNRGKKSAAQNAVAALRNRLTSSSD